jgi:hypothetical protein
MAICPSEHKHSQVSTCYVLHKCRCDECRVQHAARERNRTKLKAYGRFDAGLVPAGPVRDHVTMLQQSGIGWKRISELSGVGKTAVSQLIYGRKGSNKDPRKGEQLKRFSRVNAEKLLALQPSFENLRPGAIVDGRAVARRLQALAAVGWSLNRQSIYIGRLRTNMAPLVIGSPVSKATHDKVCAMFDDLWNKKPPMESSQDRASYTRTLRHAKRMKWVPPLAWDDIDTDERPAVVESEDIVDEFAIESALMGHEVKLTSAERRVAALRLLGQGKSTGQVAEIIKTNPRVIERWKAA